MKTINKYINYLTQHKNKHELINYDIVLTDNTYMLRSKAYQMSKNDRIFHVTPKKLLPYYIDQTKLIKSPYSISSKTPNNAQNYIYDYDYQIVGNGLFELPCGSGKTLAGISVIQKLKLKTMIVAKSTDVNSQWKTDLLELYPRLEINDKNEDILTRNDLDIYIVTPQYLRLHIKDPNFLSKLKFGLIVYDEIHTLVSEEFQKSFGVFFKLVLSGYISNLPIFLGLSATIDESNKLLETIFGPPEVLATSIIEKKVNYLDFRDMYTSQQRGINDINYKPFDCKECLVNAYKLIEYFVSKRIIELPHKYNKLVVLTDRIEETFYAAAKTCIYFKSDVLIVREKGKNLYLKYSNIPLELYENDTLDINERLDYEDEIRKVAIKCSIEDYLSECSIIVSTMSRLSQGFNCEYITLGICTQFYWSLPTRIQLLGRIRRNSSDRTLYERKRIFIVNSYRIPTNYNPNSKVYCIRRNAKVTYNLTTEKSKFTYLGYNRLRFDTSVYKQLGIL